MAYPQKKTDLKSALHQGTDHEALKQRYQEGITSQELVQLLQASGMRFSEATLRKYVQLGLLPRSQRVARAQKGRGSIGLYPIAVVRMIEEIKSGIRSNATLDQLKQQQGLTVHHEALNKRFDELMEQLTLQSQKLPTAQLRRAVDTQIKLAQEEFAQIEQRLLGIAQQLQS